ncbi:MAG: hypothetical protein KKF44_07155, partial [Nanoarchaeota archaeon]|nr:hypothetical protein [Nanoarchaeota archaeon]
MRIPTLSQEQTVLIDEKKWIRKETKIFEKVFPFLKGHLLWKILLLILILIFIINNIALFTTIVF